MIRIPDHQKPYSLPTDFNLGANPLAKRKAISERVEAIFMAHKWELACFALFAFPLFLVVMPIAYVLLKRSVKSDVVTALAKKRLELLNGTLPITDSQFKQYFKQAHRDMIPHHCIPKMPQGSSPIAAWKAFKANTPQAQFGKLVKTVQSKAHQTRALELIQDSILEFEFDTKPKPFQLPLISKFAPQEKNDEHLIPYRVNPKIDDDFLTKLLADPESEEDLISAENLPPDLSELYKTIQIKNGLMLREARMDEQEFARLKVILQTTQLTEFTDCLTPLCNDPEIEIPIAIHDTKPNRFIEYNYNCNEKDHSLDIIIHRVFEFPSVEQHLYGAVKMSIALTKPLNLSLPKDSTVTTVKPEELPKSELVWAFQSLTKSQDSTAPQFLTKPQRSPNPALKRTYELFVMPLYGTHFFDRLPRETS